MIISFVQKNLRKERYATDIRGSCQGIHRELVIGIYVSKLPRRVTWEAHITELRTSRHGSYENLN